MYLRMEFLYESYSWYKVSILVFCELFSELKDPSHSINFKYLYIEISIRYRKNSTIYCILSSYTFDKKCIRECMLFLPKRSNQSIESLSLLSLLLLISILAFGYIVVPLKFISVSMTFAAWYSLGLHMYHCFKRSILPNNQHDNVTSYVGSYIDVNFFFHWRMSNFHS